MFLAGSRKTRSELMQPDPYPLRPPRLSDQLSSTLPGLGCGLIIVTRPGSPGISLARDLRLMVNADMRKRARDGGDAAK